MWCRLILFLLLLLLAIVQIQAILQYIIHHASGYQVSHAQTSAEEQADLGGGHVVVNHLRDEKNVVSPAA